MVRNIDRFLNLNIFIEWGLTFHGLLSYMLKLYLGMLLTYIDDALGMGII